MVLQARAHEQERSALVWAQQYAKRGWRVIPIHSITTEGVCSCAKSGSCSSPGKHPRTMSGLKEGTRDLEQIAAWWERWPDASVGVVTGEESGIVVVDVDVDKGGEESLSALETANGELPPTTIAATGGGGMHYVFRHPGSPVKTSAGQLGPGLDVRGDGGYIVAPPSNHASGGTYDWLLAPEEQEPSGMPSWLLESVRGKAPRQNEEAAETPGVGGAIPEGQRNERLASLAGSLRAQGAEEAELVSSLLEINRDRCVPPLPEAEIEAIAHSIASYPIGRKRHKLTDYGNAERLIDRHGEDLRFSPGFGWLIWDGARWRRDEDGEVLRRMKDTVRAEWATIPNVRDYDERLAIIRHLNRSESAGGLKAGLEVAKSERAVVVSADALDADPWLLAVANGTLDLQSGDLLPYRREDLITRLAPAAYVAGARSDLWERFLETVTGRDEELQSFLQRAVGYSLTGFTVEEVLFFCHGPAASGKSTFLEAIKGVAGDHALTTDFETLLKKPGGSGVRNDIARLAGARVVVGVEVDEGRALAEGLIKTLTGGDRITARLLYKEYFEFTPRFTLWLAANDRPLVRASDSGMWRRILQLPFTQAIPEAKRDPGLKQKLRDDPEVRSAILAWAVEGCRQWQKGRLQVPDRVRAYTEEYRAEVDPLSDFFEEYTILGEHERVERSRLHEAHRAWAQKTGEQTLTPKALANALKQRGIGDGGKSGNARYWQGISLTKRAGDDEDQATPF